MFILRLYAKTVVIVGRGVDSKLFELKQRTLGRNNMSKG